MIYSDFNGIDLPLLGFGTMRLPLLSDKADSVDTVRVSDMTDYAISHGVNYFDTAYPYHGGESERIIGRILKKYPRDCFYLATKYPGHQISQSYDPAAIFEEQLHKCGVDYFDFYLLHNVHENSIRTYCDPRWGIIDYFLGQKKKGRIRFLGFSCHGGVDNLREFLDLYGDKMDFCQIQLNYLDWTLQDAKAKYALLTERNIPVWVMEPVRGGKLAKLSDESEKKLKSLRPDESIPAWAFRFLQGLPNVKMILSGMSDMEQMLDNVHTFETRKPLSQAEQSLLFDIADGMKNSLPCTACQYCLAGCPQKLNIPMLLSLYNDFRFSPGMNLSARIDALPDDKRPSACIGCGKCTKMCPQKIDIPAAMREFADKLSGMPSWADVCRQREEAKKLKP